MLKDCCEGGGCLHVYVLESNTYVDRLVPFASSLGDASLVASSLVASSLVRGVLA